MAPTERGPSVPPADPRRPAASTVGLACVADTAPEKPDGLSAARTLIAARKWDGAIAELKRGNDTEPKHRAALEYSGELYLRVR